jgi:hypothetical protein
MNMKTKWKVVVVVLVGLSALAYLGTHLRNPISDARTFGGQQDGPQKSMAVQRDKEATTKRVDLGDGVELIETSESRNGEVVSRYTKVTRKGETLLTCSWVTQLGKGIRTYYHDGKEVVSEVLDKDGGVEMLILVGTGRTPIEVFERKKDGTILPVGSDRLDEMKKGAKLISETFGPIVEAARKGTDEQRMRGLVEDAVEKAKDATNQSSGNKRDSGKRSP